MTLISTILLDGYREANMIALGRALNDLQTTEALRLLQGVIDAIYGTDAGEIFQDWTLGDYGRESPQYYYADARTDYQIDHPPINQRLIATNEAARTVYLTPRPQDGSRYGIVDPFSRLAAFPVTLDANGRTIEDALTLLLDSDGLNRQWFYRADLGSWVRITDLAVDGEMPFPRDFDNMFIILLAMRLSPRYGRELSEASAEILRAGRRNFMARYLQSRPLEIDDSISWPFMSTQAYDQDRSFSSTVSFNRGSPFQ